MRKRIQKTFKKPSLTQQHFRDSCDISVIVRNFAATGTLPQRQQEPRYGVAHGDFQEAQFAMATARSTFETLRPEVRAKYGDVNEIIRAMDDPARASELASDGILQAFDIPLPPKEENANREETAGAGEQSPPPADSAQAGDEVTSA